MKAEQSILVIGQDCELYNTVALRLKPCGYGLRSALSAREALGCLKDHPFDLSVLDLQLPDAHGLCLLAIMKRLYPRLPVLVLSADETTETMIHALRLGARAYLLAPVDLGQLLYCIDETLKVRQAELRSRYGRRGGRSSGRKTSAFAVRPRRIYRGILNEVEEEM